MIGTTDLHHLFVYGTLRRGCGNHRYLERAIFVGEARTRRGFRLRDLGYYPGMVRDGGQGRVRGEVYAVDPTVLASVDRLEGHPTFYLRTGIVLDGGIEVETYLLRAEQVDGRTVIPGGDWSRRRR